MLLQYTKFRFHLFKFCLICKTIKFFKQLYHFINIIIFFNCDKDNTISSRHLINSGLSLFFQLAYILSFFSFSPIVRRKAKTISQVKICFNCCSLIYKFPNFISRTHFSPSKQLFIKIQNHPQTQYQS